MGGKGGPKGGAPAPPGGGGKGGGKEAAEAEKKARREAEKAAIAKKKADETAHMEFLEQLPKREPADIANVRWSGANRQIILAGGTSLVELESGNIVCVRHSRQPAAEYMADRVAAALGFKAAKLRLLRPDEKEYQDIEEMERCTRSYLEDMPMLFEDFMKEMNEAHQGDIPTEIKRPLVDKFEYTIPTKATHHLGCPEKVKATCFVIEFLKGKGLDQCCGKLDADRIHALGRIAALDALLNQSDQVALPIWRESGNLTNVMMAELGKTTIVGVEQCVQPIIDDSALQDYLSLVSTMFTSISTRDPEAGPLDGGFEKAAMDENHELLKKCGFMVAHVDMLDFLSGLREGFQAIGEAERSGSLAKALQDASAAATQSIRQDAQSITSSDCARFVASTAAVIAKATKSATESMSVEAATHRDTQSAQRQGGQGTQREAENCCQKSCSLM